jgi:hypothetical protein
MVEEFKETQDYESNTKRFYRQEKKAFIEKIRAEKQKRYKTIKNS